MNKRNKICSFILPLLLVLAMASVIGVAAAAQDTTKPVINSVNVSDNAPIAGKTIIVTVNATDNSNITVVANNIVLTKQNGSIYTASLMVLDGTHSVNVSAKDAAGNIAWNNQTSYTASLEKPVQTPTTVATTVKVKDTTAANPEPTKTKTTPGFEGFIAVIALAGLMLARKIR